MFELGSAGEWEGRSFDILLLFDTAGGLEIIGSLSYDACNHNIVEYGAVVIDAIISNTNPTNNPHVDSYKFVEVTEIEAIMETAQFFNRAERDDKQQEALLRMRDFFLPKYLATDEGREEDNGFLSDETFIRYLKARNWNVDKATAMLEETVKWRREFEVNALMRGKWDEEIRRENASGKLYIRGMDKYGNTLVYMRPRHENSKDHDNNIRHLVYNLERALIYQHRVHNSVAGAEAADPENNHKPNRICLIVDYLGFTLSNSPPLKTSLAVLSILQNHYPERLKCAYLLRAPWVFSTTFNLISPFIDPVSRAKLVFVKTNDPVQLAAQLTPHIAAEVLEADVGGNNTELFDSTIYMNADVSADYSIALRQSRGESVDFSREFMLTPVFAPSAETANVSSASASDAN